MVTPKTFLLVCIRQIGKKNDRFLAKILEKDVFKNQVNNFRKLFVIRYLLK